MKTPDSYRQGFQKLLGSGIYVTSTFYDFEGEFGQYIGLTPFLYFYDTIRSSFLQDGMFHKKQPKKLEKLRMDIPTPDVV